MSPKSDLLEAFTADKALHIAFLQSFVRPLPQTHPGSTEAAAKVLTTYLASQNISYTLIEPQAGKPNIVCEFSGGAGPGPRVILNGHIDVFPSTHNNISMGPRPLAREHLRGSVALCAVSDEETGGRWGTQYLIKQNKERWGGDVMFSAEPRGRTIWFSEKGTLRVSGSVRMKGAHGAYLDVEGYSHGDSILNDVIDAVESIEPTPPPEIALYLLNTMVLRAVDEAIGADIGTISGGVKVSMIPDHCAFELDIRLPIGLVAETVMGVIDDIARKRKAASNPSGFSAIDHPTINVIKDNTEATGIDEERPVMIPSMGATDCKHYRYAGVPAYVYGFSPLTTSVNEFLHVTKVHALTLWDF
ncbi:hypothetical protein BDW66DRAFT_163757 [Aspergillus desertorum]